MCMLGLQVDERRLNKKPTGILSNHPRVLRALDGHLCDGAHRHAILEGSLQTSRAARYPSKFVRRVARAVAEHWQGVSKEARPTWAELSELSFPAEAGEGDPPGEEAEAEEDELDDSGGEHETRPVDGRKGTVIPDEDPSEEE
eukprot:3970062-Pyramimonas_sp.AAC.1